MEGPIVRSGLEEPTHTKKCQRRCRSVFKNDQPRNEGPTPPGSQCRKRYLGATPLDRLKCTPRDMRKWRTGSIVEPLVFEQSAGHAQVLPQTLLAYFPDHRVNDVMMKIDTLINYGKYRQRSGSRQ